MGIFVKCGVEGEIVRANELKTGDVVCLEIDEFGNDKLYDVRSASPMNLNGGNWISIQEESRNLHMISPDRVVRRVSGENSQLVPASDIKSGDKISLNTDPSKLLVITVDKIVIRDSSPYGALTTFRSIDKAEAHNITNNGFVFRRKP